MYEVSNEKETTRKPRIHTKLWAHNPWLRHRATNNIHHEGYDTSPPP